MINSTIKLKYFLNLSFESTREHLIGFVHDKESQIFGSEEPFFHHIVNSSWGSDNNMNSALQNFDVFSDTGSSDACMNFDFVVLSDGVHHKCTLQGKLSCWSNDKRLSMCTSGINNLQCRNSESTSLTSTRLRLSDCVMSLDDWENTFLLNR